MFNKILEIFINSKLWKKLASHLVGGFTFRVFGYPKFPMMKYHRLKRKLIDRPEWIYVFVGADTDALSYRIQQKFTKAEWSHSGFVFYNEFDDRTYINHMNSHGFKIDDVLSYLRRIDKLKVFRLPIKDVDKFMGMISKLRTAKSILYDYPLDLDGNLVKWLNNEIVLKPYNKAFKIYCSELINALAAGNCEVELKAVKRFGRLSFTPDDLANQLADYEISLEFSK